MKQWNLYTPIKYQKKTRLEDLVIIVFEWCIDEWGLNPKRKDILYIECDYDGEGYRGTYEYDDNLITIWPRAHTNIRDIIDTVIHEFTHQRQAMVQYWRLDEIHGYKNHPFEIEATEVAKKCRKKCWNEIKHLV